jgi:hypothetical protein
LIINIKISSTLATIVLCAHSGALLLMFALPIVPGLGMALAALISASLWWQWRHGVWASAGELRLEEDGSCTHTANGKQRRYRITRATAHAGFVRLTMWRTGERTRTQLVLRDAVEPEVYRALRARIVQRRLPVSDKTPA